MTDGKFSVCFLKLPISGNAVFITTQLSDWAGDKRVKYPPCKHGIPELVVAGLTFPVGDHSYGIGRVVIWPNDIEILEETP